MVDSSKTLNLMGGSVELTLYDVENCFAELYFHDIYSYALKLQKIFDFYDSESELSLLNKRRERVVSSDLLYVIKKALYYSKETGGLYDISFGKKILQRKSKKSVCDLNCSYKNIEIDGNKVTLNHPDVLIDLGSIAKGYIVDKIAEYLKQLGVESCLINARGDILIFGERQETVYIQHPRDKTKLVHPIKFGKGALATSGDYKQYDSSYENSHIVGGGKFASVTVFAENLTEADVAATCIFLLGGNSEDFVRNRKLKVLVIGKDLKTVMFNGFEEILLKEGAYAEC